jgi:ATP-dependent Zn protease
VIDAEITKLLREAEERAKEIVSGKRQKMDELVKELLVKETVEQEEFRRIVGDGATKPIAQVLV